MGRYGSLGGQVRPGSLQAVDRPVFAEPHLLPSGDLRRCPWEPELRPGRRHDGTGDPLGAVNQPVLGNHAAERQATGHRVIQMQLD